MTTAALQGSMLHFDTPQKVRLSGLTRRISFDPAEDPGAAQETILDLSDGAALLHALPGVQDGVVSVIQKRAAGANATAPGAAAAT